MNFNDLCIFLLFLLYYSYHSTENILNVLEKSFTVYRSSLIQSLLKTSLPTYWKNHTVITFPINVIIPKS